MSQSGSISSGIAPGGDVLSLQGDTGGTIFPNGAGTVFLVGGPNIDVAGNPGANTLQVNLTDSNVATVTTTNDTPTILYGYALDEDEIITIDAIINGVQDDYSSGIGGRLTATARRQTGMAATLVGLPIVNFAEDSPGNPSFTAAMNGNTLQIYVTGVAATTINWQARIFFQVG